MSGLKLFLLGSPRLERDGAPLELKMRKNMALIAYLAVTGHSHTREALIALLWPELEPSRARAGLRRNLSMLKRALAGEWLAVERETVGTDPNADLWLDVSQFRALLQSCQEHGHPQAQVCPDCLNALAEAVELYRGDFMEGFGLRDSVNFDEWQFFQTESLRQELTLALETLARGHSAQGAHQSAVPYARRWLALDPLHEPAQRCLMRLYAWSGQRAAALRQYAACQRVLEQELGAPPGEETTQLYQAIKQRQESPPPQAHTISPVSAQTPSRKHNLPVQLTPFVGRETTLAEIRERLDDPACRLLTLIGPGGSGKTRLALQTAEELVQERPCAYAHGVFFVSLAPLDAVEAIVPTIAQALGYSFYQAVEPQQQLLDYLRQKDILLILDNWEHLLPPSIPPSGGDKGGADLLTEILKTAPAIKILATSRVKLNVGGEHRYRVMGMAYPQDAQQREDALQYSAVKLFLQSARRAQPSFELTDENLDDVVQICRLVGGMPLGLRLAAAWVEMLTPAEITTEIGRNLDFLETDRRDVPQRQRSMRAVFDHSWRLLTEREREIFQGLSVFRGGFTHQAAQQVTGASLRQLMTLVNKSLLQREPTGRYQAHELSHQFTAEKLAQSPTARETTHGRHSAYYVAALQGWAADLKGPRQQAALAEMDAELENARAAWNWALEQGAVQRLEQAMEGLCLFYTRRGRYREGRAACQAAAEKLHADPGIRAKALAWQGVFNQELGRPEAANTLLRQSLDILDPQADQPARAFALLHLGELASERDREAAQELYQQSLACYQALDDRWGMAHALNALGWLAWGAGDYDQAQQFCAQSLALRQAIGDRWGVATSTQALGRVALALGRQAEGERLARESIAILREIGDWAGVANGLNDLGITLMAAGKYDETPPLLQESAAICQDLGFRVGLVNAQLFLSLAEGTLGDMEEPARQVQRCLALAREIDYQWGIGYALYLLAYKALYAQEHAEAQRLSQESASVFCKIGQREEQSLALINQGAAARGLGQLTQAGQYFYKSLQIAIEIGAFTPLVGVLAPIALLLADQGQQERAVELYALASCYPVTANSRWAELTYGQPIAAIAASLTPEVAAAAQERGRARDLQATVAELLTELETKNHSLCD